MTPLPYVWPIAVLFWAAVLWTASGELPLAIRDNRSGAAPADRGSKLVVQGLTLVATLLAFIAASWLPQFAIVAGRRVSYAIGVFCIAAGGLLRRHCFRMLGDRFTFRVRVEPGQRIVVDGAYRYLRHPSYTAGLLLMAGIGLALGNWIGVAAAVLPTAAGYAYRIQVEEHALIETLGPAYADYMKRTRRVIPFIC